MKSRSGGDGGELTISTAAPPRRRAAAPPRDVEHLARLLAEHLCKMALLDPVRNLALVAARPPAQGQEPALL